MSDFCEVVTFRDVNPYHPENTLQAVKNRVNKKIAWLQRRFPEGKKTYAPLRAELLNMGLTPETTYLFMQGHSVFENVVMPLLTPVCTLLRKEREREIVIRDNVSNGEWDNDILRDAWGECPLEDWGVSVNWKAEEEPKEAKEDDFSEEDAEQAPAICQKGDMWQLGEHRLMCGDSTENQDVEKLVGGGYGRPLAFRSAI
jgi:hypothetical protein